MNYEKKYKDALERAKEKKDEYKRLDGEESFVPFDIEYIFPELKESEDENIKKLKKIDARENLTLDGDLMEADCMVVEQKSAWNEEDETGLSTVMWAIKQAKSIAKDENDMGNLWYAERWLKSIKDCLVTYGNIVTKNIEKSKWKM